MADKKEKMTRVFQMTPDTALLFFVIVQWSVDHGVQDTPKFRQYILDWLAKGGHMDRVYDTKRTEDQIVSDYKKHGYNIQDKRLQKISILERIKKWIM